MGIVPISSCVLMFVMILLFVSTLVSLICAFMSNHNEDGKQIHSNKTIHIFFIIFIVSLTCLVLSIISYVVQNYIIHAHNKRSENIEIVTDEN